jgi:hypothetical protein
MRHQVICTLLCSTPRASNDLQVAVLADTAHRRLLRLSSPCVSSSCRGRQFVLLSDVLGVSALVDVMEEETTAAPGSTPQTVLGPFHIAGK